MAKQVMCRWRPRAVLLSIVICLLVVGVPLESQARGQAADANGAYVPSLTFDVASIRESHPADSYTVSFMNPPHSSLLKLTNNSIENLIAIAYGIRWSQIEGLPDWGQTFFMVEAKSDDVTDEKLAELSDGQARAEKQHMLQALLADRFQLKARWQQREGTVYDLVVAKGGPKMSTKLEPPSAEEKARFGNHPVPDIYQFGDGRLGYQFIAHGATMGELAGVIASHMEAEVADKTGLGGKYDFKLRYSGTVSGTESRNPEAWPLLITAIGEQLGLKLSPSKGPVQVLVIDHIEKPSPN